MVKSAFKKWTRTDYNYSIMKNLIELHKKEQIELNLNPTTKIKIIDYKIICYKIKKVIVVQ